MKGIMTASSTSNMSFFSRKFAHRSGAFRHCFSHFTYCDLAYTGGGDIITTLSPRTTIVPKSLDLLSSKISTES
jgi:hypothetical protein